MGLNLGGPLKTDLVRLATAQSKPQIIRSEFTSQFGLDVCTLPAIP